MRAERSGHLEAHAPSSNPNPTLQGGAHLEADLDARARDEDDAAVQRRELRALLVVERRALGAQLRAEVVS